MITNVQALRFWAAMAVFLFHAAPYFKEVSTYIPMPAIDFARGIGFVGVDVFFVISGFIIWITACDKSGAKDAAEFAYNRVTRIYPPYWIAAFLAWGAHVVWAPNIAEMAHILRSLTLLPTEHYRQNMLGVSWTLSFEMYFYSIFTVAILLGRVSLIWAVAATVAVLVPALHYWKPVHGLWVDFLISPYLIEFFAGCLIARFRDRLSAAVPWLPAIIIGCVGFCVYWMIAPGKSPMIRALFLTPCSAALLIGCLSREKRAKASRTFVALGNASYALYLFHAPALVATRSVLRHVPIGPAAKELVWIGFVVVMVLFSLAFYRWFELPVMQSLRRLARPHRGQQVTATA